MQNILLENNELPRIEELEVFHNFPTVLIQVFAATDDKKHLKHVLQETQKILPQATIIGCSSDGIIDNGLIHDYGHTIQLNVTVFSETTLTLAFSTQYSDCELLGKQIASQICHNDTKAIIAFSEASTVNGELFLEGLYPYCDDIIISGGIASTPTFTDTFIIAGEEILSSGIVAVSLNGARLNAYKDFSFGWQPVGKEMTVTGVKNNRIESIDNHSPLSIFRHYLGPDIADALPGVGSAFPLMIKRGENFIARGIIALDDEAFIVSGNVKTDDKVYIGYGNPNMIAHKNMLKENIQQNVPNPEAIFAYYCEGRRLFLPENVVKFEIDHLCDSTQIAGCFTLGEFYTHETYSLLNFSSTVLILSESTFTEPQFLHTPSLPLPLADKLSSLVPEGLFHLIDVRTKELEHQTYHDELTDLPNRAFFSEFLTIELEKANVNGIQVALLFLDLDHFKNVNDTLGHSAGDTLLKIIAQKINGVLGATDLMARLGGDEFIIMSSEYHSIDRLVDLATSILQLFYEPFKIDTHSFTLGASIGISLYPDDGSNAETLIKHADAAMYEVKYNGRNNFSFYHKEITHKALQRIAIENDLREAIKNDEFLINYQPLIDLESGKIRAAEALIRWQHPKDGIIMPDQFIEIAETSGLIIPIGEIVFDKTLKQFREWLDQGLNIEKICINVSAKQFRHDNIIALVSKYLNKYALPTKYLGIELTESTIMHNSDENMQTLQELHQLGISISIDDFGTGYSSLSYLKRFEINNIKIDKSFVENLPHDTNDKAIVQAIMAMANTLGLDVIAEGIETSEQKDFFASEKCKLVQGYYFSKPVSADQFSKLFLSY
ncbi:MAG: EAL domain-containing protein [Sulfurimonadaceae bacterium]